MIMILTDKTLKDFTFWLYNKHAMKIFNIEFMKPLLFNALIIDFFDSVGIYIEIIRNDDYFDYVVMEEWDYGFEIRQEAIEKAIEKANKIYNETKV